MKLGINMIFRCSFKASALIKWRINLCSFARSRYNARLIHSRRLISGYGLGFLLIIHRSLFMPLDSFLFQFIPINPFFESILRYCLYYVRSFWISADFSFANLWIFEFVYFCIRRVQRLRDSKISVVAFLVYLVAQRSNSNRWTFFNFPFFLTDYFSKFLCRSRILRQHLETLILRVSLFAISQVLESDDFSRFHLLLFSVAHTINFSVLLSRYRTIHKTAYRNETTKVMETRVAR